MLVRTYSAGVHFGTLEHHDGKSVTLKNARRLWRWFGAFTLSEVSQTGIKDGSKVTIAVPEIHLTEAIEIIPLSDAADKILTEYPVYEV